MDGANCSTEKQESPIEEELHRLLDNVSRLREEHARLYTALKPVLRQTMPEAAGPSPTKEGQDNSSPIMLTLKEIGRGIVAEIRTTIEMTDRLEL